MTVTTGTAPAAVPDLRNAGLDIVFGDRPSTTDHCGNCGRLLPPLPAARLELELPDGDVLCLVCADKAHRGLRLVLAVFNQIMDAQAAGDAKGAAETLEGIISALELTTGMTRPTPATTPSPNRQTRRYTAKRQPGKRRHR